MTFRLAHFRKSSITWIATVAVLSAGLPSMSLFARESGPTAGAATAASTPETADQISNLQTMANAMRASNKKILVQRAARIERWIDILAAPTKAEYHAAVRRLPVAIVRSTTADGRLVKQYFAEGKLRFQATMPLSPTVQGPTASEAPSGPSSVGSECYLEEEEPCQTLTEEEDWEIEIAQAQADTEAADADAAAAQAQWELYCQQVPWSEDCQGERPSGPSAKEECAGCGTEAVAAAATVWTSAIAYLTAKGKLDDARLAGRALSASSVAASRLTMVGAAATASFSAGYFLACVVDRYIVGLDEADQGQGVTKLDPMELGHSYVGHFPW